MHVVGLQEQTMPGSSNFALQLLVLVVLGFQALPARAVIDEAQCRSDRGMDATAQAGARYLIPTRCFTDFGWSSPLSDTVLTTSTNYDYRSRFYSANNGVTWTHGGVDLVGSYSEATSVYAIGAGTVYSVSRKTAATANTSNVVVRHTALNGTQFLVTYGHVYSDLNAGDSVTEGQVVGTLRTYGSPIHLHLEVNTGDGVSGFGGVKANTQNPTQFLRGNPGRAPDTITATITGGADAGTYTFTEFQTRRMFSFADGSAYMPQLIATEAAGNRILIEYCAVQKPTAANYCDNSIYGRFLVAFLKAKGGAYSINGGTFSTTGAHPNGESIGVFGADISDPVPNTKVHIEGTLRVQGIPLTQCGTSTFAGCDPAAAEAPKVTAVNFAPTSSRAPSILRLVFSTDMGTDYGTRGDYGPTVGKEGYWVNRRTFEMQLDWYLPGGSITFLNFGFRSAAGIVMREDYVYKFPN